MSQQPTSPQPSQDQPDQQGAPDIVRLHTALRQAATEVDQLRSQYPDMDFSGLENALASAGVDLP
jgi:hypothetical protein